MTKDISFITLDDTDSSTPLYRRIYEAIRRAILAGDFEPKMRLPASRLLARQLGVSRMTVVNAYEQLLAEGYLEGKIGAGTYVAAALPEEFLQPQTGKIPARELTNDCREIKFSAYGKRLQENYQKVLRMQTGTVFEAFELGIPAIDKFPFDIWLKIVAKHHNGSKTETFGYAEPGGYFPLREAIAKHLKAARGVNCETEQVIITNGAQQALDLIAKLFIETGDSVLIENPCYIGVKNSFRSAGANLIPVAIDKEGFELAAIDENPDASLIYVTPSHQFPLGVTMSLPRRLALLEKAEQKSMWIIEDDYDSEFRYSGRPIASLQGLDKNGRVFYVGTFSKTIFPGLRLGCLVVPKDLVDIFTAARAISDSHSPLIDQAVLAEFITDGHFARHLRRMRKIYQERQEVLVEEAKKELAGLLEIDRHNAGMHLIGWLPEGANDRELAKTLVQAGIRVASVSIYSLTDLKRGGLILGYTAIDEERIRAAVRKLRDVLEKAMIGDT